MDKATSGLLQAEFSTRKERVSQTNDAFSTQCPAGSHQSHHKVNATLSTFKAVEEILINMLILANFNCIDVNVTSEASSGCEGASETGPRKTKER